MVVRVNTPTYSVANKTISTSDERDANGQGSGRYHGHAQKEHPHQEIENKKVIITVDELQAMVETLNKSDYYQKKGFTFKCRDDAKELHVEVYTENEKLIQRLPPDQILKMAEALKLSANHTGNLINVSC